MAKEERLHPEILDSIGERSLGVLGTSQRALLYANRTGYIDLDDREFSYVTRSGNELAWKSPTLQYIKSSSLAEIKRTFEFAFAEALKSDTPQTPTIPFVITIAKPPISFDHWGGEKLQRIPIDRIVNALDLGEHPRQYLPNELEFVELLEDNIGRIDAMVKRFSKPQELAQV